MRIPLNNDWLFYREDRPDEPRTVRIPHSNINTPFNYFSQQDYQFVSIYEKTLIAGPEWRGKTVLLCFQGVAHAAEVLVNGRQAMRHLGGYTAFRADIAGLLDYSGPNLIKVIVDSRCSINAPPFGGLIDYMTYGGIYREVFLDIREKTWIGDIFVHGDHKRLLTVQVSLAGAAKGCGLRFLLTDHDNILFEGRSEQLNLQTTIEAAELWDIDNPRLYDLSVELEKEGIVIDRQTARVGFRTCRFTADGFFLNGQKIKLVGLNRHQSYPYAGYAMPARVQRRDALILKNELKLNCVRTSHYPQSHHFIDACDEQGLLVLTEIPGWQHIGDQAWQDIAREQVREMVTQYRNHPSIILWGVRINESQDCDELYRDTNAIARSLDPTRQTNGVRYIRHSRLLEDVYTFNDFSCDGRQPVLQKKKAVTRKKKAPYLITEYCGHMFPAKSFDPEAQRQEHALRHAAVLNQLFADDQIAGGLGWCMADYNTNRDFGSGDHICYHGVLDMFRNPKPAAAVYASNQEKDLVLFPGSDLNKGDYPRALPDPLHVFTNADSIRLYRNENLITEYKAENKSFPYLKHPPVLVDDFLGEKLVREENLSSKNSNRIKAIIRSISKTGLNRIRPSVYIKVLLTVLASRKSIRSITGLITRTVMGWGDEQLIFRLEAIVGGKAVKSVQIGEMKADHLDVDCDTTHLVEGETYDVASIRIRAADQFGRVLPYYLEPVSLVTEGAIELTGPALIALKGGMAGTYVRSTGEAGTGRLTIKCPGMPEVRLSFDTECRRK